MNRLAITILAGAVGCFLPKLAASAVEALPSTPAPGTYSFNFKIGDFERTALVHVPKSFKGTIAGKLPLVIALHGAGGHGGHMLEADHWAEKSDTENFFVVAPDGLPLRPWLSANIVTNPAVWNAGQLKPGSPRREIDDVAFIQKLLDKLKDKIPCDPQRTFVAGHSNGGSMAFRLGNELSDHFAAIAEVAGQMTIDQPHPKRPLPTLCIYGTKDPVLPVDGGESHLPWGSRVTPPVADRLAIWAKALGCETTPKTLSDKDGVRRVEYAAKTPGGPTLTALYLEGHGHHWPGSTRSLPPAMMGPNTSKLDATETIWEFFKSR